MKWLLSIIIFTSTILYRQDKVGQIDKKLLIGHWTSLDDNKYSIFEKTATFLYKIDKDKLTKTDKDDGEVYKYDILS